MEKDIFPEEKFELQDKTVETENIEGLTIGGKDGTKSGSKKNPQPKEPLGVDTEKAWKIIEPKEMDTSQEEKEKVVDEIFLKRILTNNEERPTIDLFEQIIAKGNEPICLKIIDEKGKEYDSFGFFGKYSTAKKPEDLIEAITKWREWTVKQIEKEYAPEKSQPDSPLEEFKKTIEEEEKKKILKNIRSIYSK